MWVHVGGAAGRHAARSVERRVRGERAVAARRRTAAPPALLSMRLTSTATQFVHSWEVPLALASAVAHAPRTLRSSDSLRFLGRLRA